MKGFLGLAAAAALAFSKDQTPHHQRRGRSTAYSSSGWGSRGAFNGGGFRECARRRDQIAAGQLKRENGLDPELSARLEAEGR